MMELNVIDNSNDKTIKILFNNENDFKKKLRSLKRYCPRAYKEVIFNFKNTLNNDQDGLYKKTLTTSKEFRFIYGQIEIVYQVKKNIITIITINPSQFLLDGYVEELKTYKGVFYRNSQDKFKIDLFNSMKVVKKK